jgi:hypothetical protein
MVGAEETRSGCQHVKGRCRDIAGDRPYEQQEGGQGRRPEPWACGWPTSERPNSRHGGDRQDGNEHRVVVEGGDEVPVREVMQSTKAAATGTGEPGDRTEGTGRIPPGLRGVHDAGQDGDEAEADRADDHLQTRSRPGETCRQAHQ